MNPTQMKSSCATTLVAFSMLIFITHAEDYSSIKLLDPLITVSPFKFQNNYNSPIFIKQDLKGIKGVFRKKLNHVQEPNFPFESDCLSRIFRLKDSINLEEEIEKGNKESIVITCPLKTYNEFVQINTNILSSEFGIPRVIYEGSECSYTNNQNHFECQFIFSLKAAIQPEVHFRILTETQEKISNNVTDTSRQGKAHLTTSSQVGLVLIVLVVSCLILLVTIIICIRIKKRKSLNKKGKGDRQKLVTKPPSLVLSSLPEVSSPSRGLNVPQNIFALEQEQHTGMSPLHGAKSADLRLEENGRSSLVPDEIILTNVEDSPKSASDSSSQVSRKDVPKTLDFNIEFSMVEQESIMKIKKTIENKKIQY